MLWEDFLLILRQPDEPENQENRTRQSSTRLRLITPIKSCSRKSKPHTDTTHDRSLKGVNILSHKDFLTKHLHEKTIYRSTKELF